MILYLLAVVAALVVALGGVRVGLPALHSWQYGRCLARIAVLERDLGIPVSNPDLLPRPSTSPQDVAERWRAGVSGWSESNRKASDNYRDAVMRFAASGKSVTKRAKPSDEYRAQWRRY